MPSPKDKEMKIFYIISVSIAAVLVVFNLWNMWSIDRKFNEIQKIIIYGGNNIPQ